jgi:alkyl sulfatase BDS1-like metallo-beta-lactamase superfamily hydrolase
MNRRMYYMLGSLLPPGPQGQARSGIGLTISGGAVTFIPPTDPGPALTKVLSR